jgi:hypothetical protein
VPPHCDSPACRRPSVLVALCWMRTREQIGEREKRGKEANELDGNEWMSRVLHSEATDKRIGAIGVSG